MSGREFDRDWWEKLKEKGLFIALDPNTFRKTGNTLECSECGKVFSPEEEEGGYASELWWKCPNGCNQDF